MNENNATNQDETAATTQKKMFALRMPKEMHQALRAHAIEEHRSCTSLIIDAIERYLKKEVSNG